MRLFRFLHLNHELYGSLIDEKKVVCLPVLSDAMKRSFPMDLGGLVCLGLTGIQAAEKLVRKSTESERMTATLPIADVTLLAPIPLPPKIVCLGLNYRDHAQEIGASLPDEPIFFMKPRTSIIGPDESIVRPSFVRQLDYEAELAIVIGRKGKDIPVSIAGEYIFGYTAFNDVSARDVQFKDKQWTRGKSFDTFAPIGPCITTANQIEKPADLRICARVNGELRQNSSTKNMVFDVYEIVHHISRVMTLEPGDLIATGTPAGVGAFMKPQPRFLSPGDVVKIEIENIGILRNMVAEA